MIDLCVGPHIPHTGKIKAFMVTKVDIRIRGFKAVANGYLTELIFVFPW